MDCKAIAEFIQLLNQRFLISAFDRGHFTGSHSLTYTNGFYCVNVWIKTPESGWQSYTIALDNADFDLSPKKLVDSVAESMTSYGVKPTMPVSNEDKSLLSRGFILHHRLGGAPSTCGLATRDPKWATNEHFWHYKWVAVNCPDCLKLAP